MSLVGPPKHTSRHHRCSALSANMSGDSDDNISTPEFVFYRDREEWKDVVPIPQNDGEFPIVKIAYSEQCKAKYYIIARNRCAVIRVLP